jgi:succinate-acetate transporter protein
LCTSTMVLSTVFDFLEVTFLKLYVGELLQIDSL